MIEVFLGLSGLNIEKNAKQAKNKRILARRSRTLEESYLISSPQRRVYGGPTT